MSPLCAWTVGLLRAYPQGCPAALGQQPGPKNRRRSHVYCLLFYLVVVLLEEGGFLLKLPVCTLPSIQIQESWAVLFYVHAASCHRMHAPHPKHHGICRDPALLPRLQLACCGRSSPVLPPHFAGSWTRSPCSAPWGRLCLPGHSSKLASCSCTFQAVMQSCRIAQPRLRCLGCGIKEGAPWGQCCPRGLSAQRPGQFSSDAEEVVDIPCLYL